MCANIHRQSAKGKQRQESKDRRREAGFSALQNKIHKSEYKQGQLVCLFMQHITCVFIVLFTNTTWDNKLILKIQIMN